MLKRNRVVLTIFVCVCMSLTFTLHALYYKPVTLDQMVTRAEAIVHGRCVDKKSAFIAGHIETQVTIEVDEYLKGDMGEKGDQGDEGDKGDDGDKGGEGDKGDWG